MSSTSRLIELLAHAEDYPRNAYAGELNEYSTIALEDQLEKRHSALFNDQDRSCVDFYESLKPRQSTTTYERKTISSVDELQAHLEPSITPTKTDPKWRFIFIRAPHSRERLQVSRRIMLQLLTFFQVMPAYLEQIFPFGRQHHRRDFHARAFRSETRIDGTPQTLCIPELHRSGQQLEICYNLKSVESSDDPEQEWSVRQCSVYHQFDLKYHRALWIIVKGNDLMRDMCQSCFDAPAAQHASNIESFKSELESSLNFHLQFCKWSAENWHWFLNSLENSLQERTRLMLATMIDPGRDQRSQPPPPPPSMLIPPPDLKIPLPSEKATSGNSAPGNLQSHCPSTQFHGPIPTDGKVPPFAPHPPLPHKVQRPKFSFRDLQHLQSLEERGNDTLLILQANSQVLDLLKNEYNGIVDLEDLELGECKASVRQFERSMNGILSDFSTLQTRAQTLISLIQERKNLLYGLLQYQNMEASRDLAEQAHDSSKNMEKMTQQMHVIAHKTKVETVSMRIITLVTLFFLPGTFISTIMSTPIVTFKHGGNNISDRDIGLGALKLYVVVSLPLVLLTFIAWYAVYWWEKRKANDPDESPV